MGVRETSGVSASGLVNIYDVLFCSVLLTMWRGHWVPTAKQVPSKPWEHPLPQPSLFLCPKVPSRPPTSRPKPDVPCPGTARPMMGPAEGATAARQEGGPTCSWLPSPHLPSPGDEGVQLSPPLFCNRGVGLGRPAFHPQPPPHLALSGPAYLSDFSKDQKKKPQENKNKNIKNKTTTKKL